MKDANVQRELKQATKRFVNKKRMDPNTFLDNVVETMSRVGGITGFQVRSHNCLSLDNHTARYTIPMQFEEYSQRLSAVAKRQYAFLEELRDHLMADGVSPRNMEYHLGKDYASKHHNPFRKVA